MASRILIVNVNWLGDVLFSTPAIRAIRRKYPHSRIACLLPSRCRDLLRRNPYLDEVLTFEEDSAASPFWTIGRLRKRFFDTAIFFHRSKTKVVWTLLAGIPRRWGYALGIRRRFLTESCDPPDGPVHKIDYFLNLLRHFGIPEDGRTLDFYPDPAAEPNLRRLLSETGIPENAPYAVVHAGGNWDLKRWPVEYFARWIRLFSNRYGWKIILCGTGPEREISDRLKSQSGPEVVSLCGKTSVDTLAFLLKGAKLLLSNDSGPLHLAASQRTPVVGLFGPTSPHWTGPVSEGPLEVLHKDVGCEIPCYFRSCNYRQCMDLLTPEEVFEKTIRLLKN